MENEKQELKVGEPENYAQMVLRHTKEIEQLQQQCKHQRWGWVIRSSGLMCGLLIRYEVKLCGKCNKEMGRRRYCVTCNKQITVSEWKEADGSDGRPFGTFFCEECWNSGKKIDESFLKR